MTLNGYTALHDAAEENNVASARLLIEAGCDVNIQDIDGWTPLYVAVQNGHTEIVKVLVNSPNISVDLPDQVPLLLFIAIMIVIMMLRMMI